MLGRHAVFLERLAKDRGASPVHPQEHEEDDPEYFARVHEMPGNDDPCFMLVLNPGRSSSKSSQCCSTWHGQAFQCGSGYANCKDMWSPRQKDLSIDPNNTVKDGHVVEQVMELGPFSSIMSKSIAKTYRNDVADKYANWGTGRVGSLSLVTIVRNTGKLAADTGLGPETFSPACKHCGFFLRGRQEA